MREGILDEKGINKLEKQVDDELQAAADRALAAAPPTPDTMTKFIYSPDLDPTSAAFDTAGRRQRTEATAADGKKAAPKTMADLINATLRDEMRRDERIVDLRRRRGRLQPRRIPDSRSWSKARAESSNSPPACKCEFGSDRVFNSPLAEANIVGRATGMATRGLKPVVEIQFFDYIWPAMMQLRNELPTDALALEQRLLRAAASFAWPSAAI